MQREVNFIKGFAPFHPTFTPLRPTYEKLFTGAKVRRKAQKIGVGRKSVYETDPMDKINKDFYNLGLPYKLDQKGEKTFLGKQISWHGLMHL